MFFFGLETNEENANNENNSNIKTFLIPLVGFRGPQN